MLFEVFLHTLSELRRTLLVWGGAILAYTLAAALVYPLLAGGAFPAWIASAGLALGVSEPAPSAMTWLNLSVFALPLPLLLSGLAIWVGSRLIAVDERSGALEMLLSYPLSRWRLVLEKFSALAAGVFLLTAAVWLLLALLNLAFGWGIPVGLLAGACLGVALLALVFGGLAYSITAYTGCPWRALAITAGIFAVTYLLGAVWLHGITLLRVLSPFYYAASLPPHAAGLSVLRALVLLALTGAALNAAHRGLEQRDLAI